MGPTTSRTRSGDARFKGVLLDWRGTLVVAPTYRMWMQTALGRLGRETTSPSVDTILARLSAADRSAIESSSIDADRGLHRAAYYAWFAAAGVDAELADTLYAVESDASCNPFAQDVGPVLNMLHTAGVRIAVVSDIHFDIRPAFAEHRDQSGTPWAALVDAWALSFELGVAKPESAIFTIALERLGLDAGEVLMVGDRGPWDGAAVDLGITTLLLPALRSVEDLRLQRVMDLVLPGAVLETSANRRPGPAAQLPAGWVDTQA